MVHQTYVNRLILGRSAFDAPGESSSHAQTDASEYVQRYDARGYPENNESRQLARRSRRAQNDILTTIGVCVCVDDPPDKKVGQGGAKEPSKAEQDQAVINIEEHTLAFWFELFNGLAFSFSTEWIVYMRRRIQTFDYYLDVPLWSITRSEYRHMDHWTFFLGGKVPFLLWRLTGDLVDVGLEWSSRYLPSSLRYDRLPEVRHIIVQRATFLLLSPLYISSKLQQLGLLTEWRGPVDTYMTGLTTLTGGGLNRSWTDISYGLITSPFPIIIAYIIVSERLERRIYTYSNALFRRPDNPSVQSYKFDAKGHDLDTTDLPVLVQPEIQPSLKDELRKDWHLFIYNVNETREYLKSFFSKSPSSSARANRSRAESNQVVTFADPESPQLPPPITILDRLAETPEIPESPEIQQADPSSTPPGSPPLSPRSSNSDPLSEVNPSAVQVRTRSGSTSTLHMDLEVHLPLTAQQLRTDRSRTSVSAEFSTTTAAATNTTGNPLPVTAGPFAGLQGLIGHLGVIDPTAATTSQVGSVRTGHARPQHRVTALTILPAQELAGQVGLICTAALMLPFETVVLRHIARAFFDARLPGARGSSGLLTSGPGSWLREAVYAPAGLGLAKYGWSGLVSYAGSVALCFGLETVIALSAWRLGSEMVMRYGMRRFGWGEL